MKLISKRAWLFTNHKEINWAVPSSPNLNPTAFVKCNKCGEEHALEQLATKNGEVTCKCGSKSWELLH